MGSDHAHSPTAPGAGHEGSLVFKDFPVKTKDQTLLMSSGYVHTLAVKPGLEWINWKLLCPSPTALTAHNHLCLIKNQILKIFPKTFLQLH